MTAVASRAGAQRALEIPPPRGMVNDFAGVVDGSRASQIEALARFVRERSGGEIAVVTLADIGDRDVADVALTIGRQWKVGAKAEIGDARRNAGVVVLLTALYVLLRPVGRGVALFAAVCRPLVCDCGVM